MKERQDAVQKQTGWKRSRRETKVEGKGGRGAEGPCKAMQQLVDICSWSQVMTDSTDTMLCLTTSHANCERQGMLPMMCQHDIDTSARLAPKSCSTGSARHDCCILQETEGQTRAQPMQHMLVLSTTRNIDMDTYTEPTACMRREACMTTPWRRPPIPLSVLRCVPVPGRGGYCGNIRHINIMLGLLRPSQPRRCALHRRPWHAPAACRAAHWQSTTPISPAHRHGAAALSSALC